MIRVAVAGAAIIGAMFIMPPDPLEHSTNLYLDSIRTTSTSTSTSTVPPAPVTTSVDVIRVTTTTEPWPDGLCSEWYVTAEAVGWPREMLPIVGEIMWRESRCMPDVIGNGGYGLLQLQWSVQKPWITDLGFSRESLLQPAANLALGWELYQRASNDDAFRCGLSPWYMSTPTRLNHWCELEEAIR